MEDYIRLQLWRALDRTTRDQELSDVSPARLKGTES